MTAENRSQKINAKIRRVADRYSCIQSLKIWIRFGLVSLGLVILFTALLFVFKSVSWPQGWLIITFAAAELVAWWYCVYRPLRRPVSLEQIALYMEEKYPEMDNRLVSAMDFRDEANTHSSPWMLDRFFEETESYTRNFTFSELLDTDRIVKLFLTSSGIFITALALIFAFYALWIPTPSAMLESETPRVTIVPSYTVEPGSARLRRGENQIVMARNVTGGVNASIRWREGEGTWQTKAMEPSLSSRVFHYSFSNLQQDIQYQVIAGNARSEIYTLTVWLPPHVESIDLTYHYPDYLGMETREVPNGGEITAIEGTRVKIVARPNKKLQSAGIALESGGRIALSETSESLWSGALTVTRDDSYSIQITDLEGERAEYDPEYKITVQHDEPPKVRIAFPNRDYEVNMLAEVPFEFHVTDDFGLQSYGIEYQIAGRNPVRVRLNPTDERIKEATAEWLLSLEGTGIEENGLITWTAWAEDAKPGREPYETLGDPYFIEIHPFRRTYQETVSNQQQQQQNEQQQQRDGDQSEAADQKQILIATWNLRRDARNMKEDEYEEKRAALEDAQRKLLDRFATESPLDARASKELPNLIEAMDKAADALQSAAWPEPEQLLSEATIHEQNAYRLILKMRPNNNQVQQRQQQPGQGNNNNQQDWQDFQQLELTRRRNFYEEERQTQAQLEETGEALDKLDELTQRQQTVQDEIAQLISEQQKDQTQAQAEEEKRRLERLQEEERRNLNRLDELERGLATGDTRNPQIQQALRDLQNVRDQMNRSAEQLEQNQLQRARASSNRALSALNEVRDRLQQDSRGAAAQRMSALQDAMRELSDNQRNLLERLQDIRKEQETPTTALNDSADEEKNELREKKTELSQKLLDLLDKASDLAQRSSESQPLTSRKLNDWLRQTSQKEIVEDINQEKDIPLIQYGIWNRAVELEEQVMDKLSQASDELDRVAETLISNDMEGMQLALNSIRETLDSMNPDGSQNQSEQDSQNQNSQQQGQQDNQQQDGQQNDQQQNGQQQDGQRNDQQNNQQLNGQRQGGQQNNQQQNGQQQGGQQSNQRQNGQQSGQQSGQQNGDQQGNPNPNQQSNQQGQSFSPRGNGQERSLTQRTGGANGPGDNNDSRPLAGDVPLRQMMDRGYRDWSDSLRDAEALLPDDYQGRRDITTIRERLEEFRRSTRNELTPPKYDLFLERVAHPLAEAARRIERDLEAKLSQNEFALSDEGQVPSTYQQDVAQYFKTLSESETNGNQLNN